MLFGERSADGPQRPEFPSSCWQGFSLFWASVTPTIKRGGGARSGLGAHLGTESALMGSCTAPPLQLYLHTGIPLRSRFLKGFWSFKRWRPLGQAEDRLRRVWGKPPSVLSGAAGLRWACTCLKGSLLGLSFPGGEPIPARSRGAV